MLDRMLRIFMLAMLCTTVALGQGAEDDPGERDTLFIGSAVVEAGQKTAIEVSFFNDEELAAFTIPISWSTPDISVDSVSFAGGRIDYIGTKPLTIYNSQQKVVFGAIVFLEANVPAGEGLMATIYFDIPPGTPDQYVYLDSTRLTPAEVLFTNVNSTNFTPEVVPGLIQIGDPQLPPHMELSPTSMLFEGTIGFPDPSGQPLSVTNSGMGTMTWSASVSAGWLSVNPSSGTAPSTTSINVDISGLADGTYEDTIVVTSPDADNSPQYVPVTLVVTKLPPTISYSPSSIAASAIQDGANPGNRYLSIWTDVPGSELNWTVSNSSGWLTLSPTTGAPPDSVLLEFDISGLSFGLYYDTVYITDPSATNSPRRVPVTLQIVSDLPVLEMDPPIVHVVTPPGTNTLTKDVLIFNSGEGVMTFSVSESSKIITGLTPTGGTAPETVEIEFNITPLDYGDHYDTVMVTSPEAVNSPQKLIIHYHVSDDPATIALIPDSIGFTYYECWQGPNSYPPMRFLQVENLGADSMYWWLTHTSDWLVVSSESGADKSFLNLTLDADDLPAGTYYDTIKVYSDEAINSPMEAVVTLEVIPGTEDPEIFANVDRNIPAQEVFGTLSDDFQVLQIYNENPGCMDWWIEEDIPWLVVIDSTGDAPSAPRALIEIGSYTWGIYPDSFFVHSASAANSPAKVYIDLLVWRLHGDFDWSNEINVGDIVKMINYTFKFGGGPVPQLLVGDCNCDRFVGVDDIIILINYTFKFGDKPCGNP